MILILSIRPAPSRKYQNSYFLRLALNFQLGPEFVLVPMPSLQVYLFSNLLA